MAKFKCDCRTHLLEMEYDKTFRAFWILIYELYSPKTGRKYKKPKLLGDVVLMDNTFCKLNELTKFFKYIKKVMKNANR